MKIIKKKNEKKKKKIYKLPFARRRSRRRLLWVSSVGALMVQHGIYSGCYMLHCVSTNIRNKHTRMEKIYKINEKNYYMVGV